MYPIDLLRQVFYCLRGAAVGRVATATLGSAEWY